MPEWVSCQKWPWDSAGKGAVRQLCKTLASRQHKISGDRCTSILEDPLSQRARADGLEQVSAAVSTTIAMLIWDSGLIFDLLWSAQDSGFCSPSKASWKKWLKGVDCSRYWCLQSFAHILYWILKVYKERELYSDIAREKSVPTHDIFMPLIFKFTLPSQDLIGNESFLLLRANWSSILFADCQHLQQPPCLVSFELCNSKAEHYRYFKSHFTIS